jgi:penicillin-binding protein 1A
VLWEPQPVAAQVLSAPEAWLMVSMMKDVVQRGTAAGSVGSRFFVPSGGKTGTTNDGADVWFIGYTADLVAGVWMGFDRPQKIKANAQGGELAAPAYTSFMTEVYRRRRRLPIGHGPEGITTREIDKTTGELANAYCSADSVVTEYFIAGTEPIQECTRHSTWASRWTPVRGRGCLTRPIRPSRHPVSATRRPTVQDPVSEWRGTRSTATRIRPCQTARSMFRRSSSA